MSPYVAQIYEEITGEHPPRPFDEKSPEEQACDRDHFIALVNQSSDADDHAIDELFNNIRMNIQLNTPDLAETKEESA